MMVSSPDLKPANPPSPVTLTGRDVVLAPLDLATHGDALWTGVAPPDNVDLWTFLSDGPFRDRESFFRYLKRKTALADRVYFAIVDGSSGRPVGFVALMRIDAANGVVEVGSVVYTKALQRTRGATEAMYLLARHVFEDLGYRRYEWKCNALNEKSRQAALRLGFTFEGVFRQHMIIKGRNRDSAWYSMLDSEWPSLKARFEKWLASENFDVAGLQKRRLADPLLTDPY